MRCINCQNLSLNIICRGCKERLFKESIQIRYIDDLEVVSLFGYSEISSLILTKYSSIGHRVYRFLAKNYLKPFLETFGKNYKNRVYLIGVDDKPSKYGFSHTATLTHYSQSKLIKSTSGSLVAKNSISYAKKSREFRESNPRGFIYSGRRDIKAILIDDVITTGTTIKEAKVVLDTSGVELLFALTLADAKR